MAGNANPIYTRVGDVTTNGTTGMPQLVTAAANDYTGVSANNTLCFTADATNGSLIERIRFKAGGSNVASVARVYINNGSDPTTAANNEFFDEVSLPATTATATAATTTIDLVMNVALPPSFRVYWGLGTAVAAGWVGVGVGGKY